MTQDILDDLVKPPRPQPPPTEATASVYYLRDWEDSLYWRPIMRAMTWESDFEPGFPEAYDHFIDLTVTPFDPTNAAEAARAVFDTCQNMDGTAPWEPCDSGERSMDIGDVIIIGDVAFRIMEKGPEEVVL